MERKGKLQKEVKKRLLLQYLVYTPEGREEGEERLPLLLFLHGAGERGSDLERVKRHGIPSFLEWMEEEPFVLAAPLCPLEATWEDKTEELLALIEELSAVYRVDDRRIYLTGLSMGGYGVWDLAAKRPDRFAAIVPICGGGNPKLAHRLKEVPVWAFHGAEDQGVPFRESEEMVQAVQACGGTARLTLYPGVGHICWPAAYSDNELRQWLFEQSKQRE
ncbi:hydrolase [Paenibacillus sp. J31TS4]|uniref:carboxylesterase family protein n=1 Tax=Paenibacillus sp. J31TS4 TaxID=2807195 RepID=UPI001B2A2600|nr:prolyl oligopeptidase family serine peptidase [Paenibacillus sp. J31TS4]GIP41456.1 hydrolase [Paenibacillus sp. J31TS4]